MLLLPPEVELFGSSVRAAVDRELIAGDALDAGVGGHPSERAVALMRQLGISAIPVPEADGGSGGSFLAFAAAIAEVSRASFATAAFVGGAAQVARAILRFGSQPQIEKWIGPLLRHDVFSSWAFTEPATGSDPRQIETRATHDGSDWVISGEKTFITLAPVASVAVVFAATSPGRLGAFVVDTSTPGWHVGAPIPLLADGFLTAPVRLDEVRVPADAVLGDPDDGFAVLIATEAEAKVRGCATCVGISERAVEEATRYALTREHRGVPIGRKFPTIQSLLGTMHARTLAARSLTMSVAAEIDAGLDVVGDAAAAKIIATQTAREVTSDAIQVCGAYGLSREFPIERLYREAKVFEVVQGVVELQRIIAARELMKAHAGAGSVRNGSRA
jgi:alkylation response protein AidB-like acyl-CoA dehydrogenase